MKDNKIFSVLCPTHRRAKMQSRFAESVYKNCSQPETCEIIFGIDNDDTIALDMAKELKEKYGDDFIKVCLVDPEAPALAIIANECAKKATGEILCNVADDVVFMSSDWDKVVKEEFNRYEDKIMLLWSDDGIWGGQLASHSFVHRNWVDTVGYLQPTHFYADWTDHWIQTMARELNRAVLIADRSRLFLEHRHAEHGHMEKDETYWKVKKRRERNVEEGLSFHSPTPEMTADFVHQFQKLKKFIDEFKKDE